MNFNSLKWWMMKEYRINLYSEIIFSHSNVFTYNLEQNEWRWSNIILNKIRLIRNVVESCQYLHREMEGQWLLDNGKFLGCFGCYAKTTTRVKESLQVLL